MTNGDDIAMAEKYVGLSELNTAFRHLSRAGDNEKPFAILLDLGPLVTRKASSMARSWRLNSR